MSLSKQLAGIERPSTVHRNLSAARLTELSISKEKSLARSASHGAF